MKKKPKPKILGLVRQLAKQRPGPVFVSDVECLNCWHEWRAVYYDPPLLFECPNCSKLKGHRVDGNRDLLMEMLGKDDDEVEF